MSENRIALDFLSHFFGGNLDEGDTFAVWTLSNKNHVWVTGPEDASFVAEKCKDQDCYFSVAAFPAGTKKRKQNLASKIFGVWLDIDVGDKGNGRSYFPTIDEAIDWANSELNGLWSILVHSGGGIHLYLLFDEALECATLDEHNRARKIVKAFHAYASSTTKYDLDPVTDLSRVMRLPGTLNTKAGMPCQIIDQNERRISPSELEDLLPEVDLDDIGPLAVVGDIEDIPFGNISSRISLMVEVDDRFKRTWMKQRRFKDDSPSTYCMALADQLCESGFSNGEILIAMQHWRQLHGASVKPLSWYKSTISKAREQHGEKLSDLKLDATIAKALETPKQPLKKESGEPAEVDRMTAIGQATAEIFGYSVVRFEKVQSKEFRGTKEKPSYRLYFKESSTPLEIESSGQLMSQAWMKQALFDDLGIVMKTVKSQKYDKVLAMLKLIEEDVESEPEANFNFIVATTVEEVLASKIDNVEVVEDIGLWDKHLVYKDESGYWGHFDLVVSRITQKMGKRVDNRELCAAMKKLGSQSARFGSRRQRLWMLPEDLTSEE